MLRERRVTQQGLKLISLPVSKISGRKPSEIKTPLRGGKGGVEALETQSGFKEPQNHHRPRSAEKCLHKVGVTWEIYYHWTSDVNTQGNGGWVEGVPC